MRFRGEFSALLLGLVILIMASVTDTVSAGKVVILRTLVHTGSFNSIEIHINGKKKGSVSNGKTLTIHSPGGKNKIEAVVNGLLGTGKAPLTYISKPGGNYFTVGWKDHIIAPYFHFRETTLAGFKKAKKRQAQHKKRILGDEIEDRQTY